ncbi:glutamine--fructose-6-phosphate transaminase (isomerizing) [Chitinilyticum litopenaei]|uniref:glutamine--fructose-6-phosphate transaminase (isomerizing) n=1 Tax=Chitinilyticum litopenaei TaxID=1121276 RepID=UPI00041404D6|nr:glutamine--fructose-6-phosphate transaminase (isomerizing) [Chitinilyticum litopenaei]
MPELLALSAPHDILPALGDYLPQHPRQSQTLDLAFEQDGAVTCQQLVVPMTETTIGRQPSLWLLASQNAQPGSMLARSPQGTVVALCGVLENQDELARLSGLGPDSDSAGILASLIDQALTGGATLAQAILQLRQQLRGYLALLVHRQDIAGEFYALSLGAPLFFGLDRNRRQLCSSDMQLLKLRAEQIHALQSGEVLQYGHAAPVILHADGGSHPLTLTAPRQLGRFPHHMLDEIYAQPAVLARLANQASRTFRMVPDALQTELPGISHILLLACGSSYHSAQIASYWLETLAGLTVQLELTSEYRYRDTLPVPHTLVIAISQSGETADTLASLRHAHSLGNTSSLAITNMPGSTLARLARHHMAVNAGEELAIFSTKTFTAQLLALYQLALAIGVANGKISAQHLQQAHQEMRRLPRLVSETLQQAPAIKDWAAQLCRHPNLFVIGRNMHYPVAMEGAFKLKEVAYLHAEGYPAGELKHGPITLVDGSLPVIACLPWNAHAEKALANLQEVRARNGEIYAFTDAALAPVERFHVIRLPAGLQELSPVIYTVALQLLAYYCGLLRGNDIDTPRHLAKSLDSDANPASQR